MPFEEVSKVDQRHEFVMLASQGGANVRALCRRFGVSPTTGYKWLQRYEEGGRTALEDRSRRPLGSPWRTASRMERRVLALRDEHPAWGGRKIRRRLMDLGCQQVPSASTVTAILRRHGRLEEAESTKHKAFERFERPRPNELWQMDFKGHFALRGGPGRCHPLTVIDDHSRFAVVLKACGNERMRTVQRALRESFRCYGLPEAILVDNGAPWGSSLEYRHTPLTAWLIRLGIETHHCKPNRPQTRGKNERFNRSLKDEVVMRQSFTNLVACQKRFDAWRHVYNCERPHEALGLEVPASRYQVSPRTYPETLPPIVYATDDIVRKVDSSGHISFRNRPIRISKAFRGYPVAIRPTRTDGRFDVVFCHQSVATIDLKQQEA